ncbi:mechanosensitive ion channel family protein [Paraliomyxa miuraensis]|uniref:mechanosensitive ion channel family protein n=1 Tax=Paraliomyxa miuraensis TaxID=376150 RepID=UPI002256DA43|nr:mechanosensitive ion channel domain-containing protein [Paraliomyxa miuraensis]MCX4244260.1 mechanosensitive ion channel family protein [Paraliomyxa miuraensis]
MDPIAMLESPLARKLLLATVGLVLVFVLRRLIRSALIRGLQDKTTRYRTRKVVAFASYLAALVVLTTVFNEELGGFTVAFGVAGAGIAFALQEVIASAAGWIAITFAGFYKVGDRVLLGGIKGDVIDIGVLRTTVFELGEWVDGDLYNGRVVRIANSFVFKEPVYNYSGDFPFLWDELTVPVRHGSDRALARAILLEVAHEQVGEYVQEIEAQWKQMTKDYVIEHAQLTPMVSMKFDENWMTFRLRYVVAYDRRRTTKDAMFEAIAVRIERSEGRVGIASAAQEITLMQPSRVDVSLRQTG